MSRLSVKPRPAHVVPYRPISVGGNVIELEGRTINGVALGMRIDLQRDDFLLSVSSS